MSRPSYVLPLIVFAQAAGTSLWFAGNAVLGGREGFSTASLTASVQAGFIGGTLVFALFALADRVRTPLLFFCCALLGALANAAIPLVLHLPDGVLALRFATGFFLAGIYPVGMKIASDWFPNGLGSAMGWLVGALVLGTAFPHGARVWLLSANPDELLWIISAIAATGGALLFLLLPAKPVATSGPAFRPAAIKEIWQKRPFRSAALGYLGHMWELYSFWAFVPLIVSWYSKGEPGTATSLLSFAAIAAGAIGCIGGGLISKKWGSAPVALVALLVSGLCCLLAPFVLATSKIIFLSFLIIWGIAAAADSPQLSTLAAQTAPAHLRGTALTVLTSAGFALTVLSLLVIQYLAARFQQPQVALIALAAGPLLGARAIWQLCRMEQKM